MANLLIVDDEQSIREMLDIAFRKSGHRVETAANVADALRKLQNQIFDLVISDIRMPQASGLDLLRQVQESHPDTLVILITAHGTTGSAHQAGQMGAFAYIEKSHELVENLKFTVERALETYQIKVENVSLKREVRGTYQLDNIIGVSSAMKQVLRLVEKAIDSSATVSAETTLSFAPPRISCANFFLAPAMVKPSS